MHDYAKQERAKYQSMTDIYNLARQGSGAKYLDIPTCEKFLAFVKIKRSVISTAENFAFTPTGKEVCGDHNFFWDQKLPESHSWKSWYELINGRFAELLEKAKMDTNTNYFHVWAGMKGDQSHD